ncbi:MAG: oxidoreductase, partial [bacterium]|nr:oxidoreductase [bacterium]
MISRRGAMVAGGASAAVVAAGGAGYLVATHDKPEPAAPASVNGEGKLLWRNWSGIQTAYPSARLAPKDESELAQMLKTAAAPIRPVGAGHSFTALASTTGALVSLDA